MTQVEEIQPEIVEQEKEHVTLKERIIKQRFDYAKNCRSGIYNEIYMEFMGDEILLEDTTPEHIEQLKSIAEMLDLASDETSYAQALNF